MTGPTHRQFSVCGAFIAAILIYRMGLSEVNYYLALPILILTSRYGAQFPDFDHEWRSVGNKTVPTWIINKLIHLTGGRHRCWQTHSIDIVVVAALMTYFVPDIMLSTGKISTVNKEVISIISMGFMSGWISHMIADMLTSAGVRLVCFMKFKIAFVPKQIFSFRFNTGHDWEAFNYKIVRFANILLGVVCLVYPAIHSGLVIRLINATLESELATSIIGGLAR